jgi:hypothetical protein
MQFRPCFTVTTCLPSPHRLMADALLGIVKKKLILLPCVPCSYFAPANTKRLKSLYISQQRGQRCWSAHATCDGLSNTTRWQCTLGCTRVNSMKEQVAFLPHSSSAMTKSMRCHNRLPSPKPYKCMCAEYLDLRVVCCVISSVWDCGSP